MNHHKTLVIIVPGSKTKEPALLKPILDKFYEYFSVEQDCSGWEFELKNYFKGKSSLNIDIFHWSGGINRTLSLNPASKKLAQKLDEVEHKYEKIILFGKSLGGVVCEKAIQKMANKEKYRLVYVATPHSRLDAKGIKKSNILNIHSEEDKYVDLANIVLHFGLGTRHVLGAKNINLEGVTHSLFNKNIPVKFKNKEQPLFDFYYNQILTL